LLGKPNEAFPELCSTGHLNGNELGIFVTIGCGNWLLRAVFNMCIDLFM
jgi:hypothetical protein